MMLSTEAALFQTRPPQRWGGLSTGVMNVITKTGS